MSSGKATPVQRKLNGEHVEIELVRLIRRKVSELLFVKHAQRPARLVAAGLWDGH